MANEKSMDFTFGIITGGSKNHREKINNQSVSTRIIQIINSISSQYIPNFEIIIVGGNDYFTEFESVKHFKFKESRRTLVRIGRKFEFKRKAYITRKKNLIIKYAKYENIVFMHDYYALAPNWYKNMVLFGDEFDIQMNSVRDMKGNRYHDWELMDLPGLNMESHLPYEVQDLNKFQYISGGYWVAKKSVMERYPLNEDLSWGEGEDIEWSKRVKKDYKFAINAKSEVNLIKEKYSDPNRKIVSSSSIANLRKLNTIKLISHRGNIDGPNKKLENSPNYIGEALNYGFDVEIDVWFIDGNYFLGHDEPQYPIPEEFLQNEKLWCHAKNLQALEQMLLNPKIHCFWHQNDTVTLTSRNIVWSFPGTKAIKGSICVLPDVASSISENCIGVCSDFILAYK
jgi:hypothetical protein